MCVDYLYNFCLQHLVRSDHKCVLLFMSSTHFSCQLLLKPEFLDRFSKNIQISNFTKIRPGGAEFSMWTVGQT